MVKSHKIFKYAATVRDLRQFIKELPDDMPIGDIGHFGEVLFTEKDEFCVKVGYCTTDGNWRSAVVTEKQQVLCLRSSDPTSDPF